MAGFMEGYGEKDFRRNRLILRIAVAAVVVAVLGAGGYFYFRTWGAERVFDQFKETLARQDYEAGYRMWCTPEKPCAYYSMEKFKSDWVPPSPYANLASASVEHVDYCGNGVVFDLSYQGADPIALWVERSTGVMSFFPYQRCPGKHLQLGPFFRRLFGKSEKG